MAEKTVEQLFTQIRKLGQDGLHHKALPLVIEVLKRNPKDMDALKCKIVCLLKLDKCKEAYHTMTTDKELSKLPMWHERAYCLYRQNKLEEAITELNNAEPSPKVDELLAQIYYKLENYEEAASIYKTLVKNTMDSYTNERETNLAAALASSSAFKSKPVKWVGVRESTYELCYNSACYSVSTGDIDAAQQKLEKSSELCKKEFEDDEAETKSELAPINVMKGLCLQKSGNNKEALELYSTVLKEKAGDNQTLAVAANNIICINKDQNMFDSKKKLKIATTDTVRNKLAASQTNSIDFNSCLLSFYTNQLEQVKKKSLQLQEAGSPLAPLLLATLLVREKKFEDALKALQEGSSQEEIVQLSIAELMKKTGSYCDSADALKKVLTISKKPGAVSLMASLTLLGAGPGAAADYLDSALEELRNSGKYTNEEINGWALQCAKFCLAHDMPEKAAQNLENLLARDPSNIKALALLIRSYSLFDAPRAHEVALRLPDIDIPADIDLEQLEIGVGVTSGRGLRKVIQPEEEKINEANRRFETKEKKRKKKKGKLPKELVEGGPDPERWIPRQERSYYRRKKRNRNEAIGKGSQGLSSVNKAAEAALDMSDKPKKVVEEESKPAKATPTPPPPQPKQQSSKPKSKGKKKGKGKW